MKKRKTKIIKFKIIAIIEARMTSTRLPGKVMRKICGKSVLELLVERLKRSKLIQEIVIATTLNKSEDIIVHLCRRLKIRCYRGSENDVLKRVLEAALTNKADIIVEITGDCPLVEPTVVDECIRKFLTGKYNYVSTGCLETTFPNGLSVQVFPTKVLAEVNALTNNPIDHEHVSLYIYKHPERYRLGNVKARGDLYWPELAITLDTPADFKLIKIIFEKLYPDNNEFTAYDVIHFLKKNLKLTKFNEDKKRLYNYENMLPRKK